MTPAEPPIIVLTEEETMALAMRLVVRHLNDTNEWLDWEDVPLLDEDGFNRLIDHVCDIRIGLERQTVAYERAADVDSREIESRVS